MAKHVTSGNGRNQSVEKVGNDVANFLKTAEAVRGPKKSKSGLIIALDATMSREQTWDKAQKIQADMFNSVAKIGGLDVQLVYFRGFGECRASKWVNNAIALRGLMTGIQCRGGETQIGKVLDHARKQAGKRNPTNPNLPRAGAMVFIGDAVEENVDSLCKQAGELGLLGLKCFMFQEGHDPMAERAFREIARLSNGAFARFDQGSASHLANLLKAVAVYASGGKKALQDSDSTEAQTLLQQLK